MMLRKLLRALLSSKIVPVWAAIAIAFTGLVIFYSISRTPEIAQLAVIVITIILAGFITLVFYVSGNDHLRISPLVDKEHYTYEVIESEMKWEILNTKGSQARLTKKRKIRFLEDGVSTLREYTWGDTYRPNQGPKKNDFQFKPGKVLDVYQEGGRWVIILGLDRPYAKFEELDIQYIRNMRNSFTGKKEWVEFQPVTNSKVEKLIVVLPANRQIKTLSGKYRYGDYVQHIQKGDKDIRQFLENKKQVIEWTIKNPIARASYLIQWEW